MNLIGLEIFYRLPFTTEHKKSKIVGLTKTLDKQEMLIMENGDHIIKGPQIICP